jgi:imidazole glycerol-phosphate synthase subunit HisF
MLKVRVLPTLLFKEFGLVKGVAFDSSRRIGSAMQTVRVFNMREVDELAFLDINATRSGCEPDYGLVDEIADECFMPLAVGGGVRTLEHAKRLLRVGADKVILNTACVETPDIIEHIAGALGSQCVVASIDARKAANGYEVVTRSGTRPTGLDPVEHAADLVRRGAGEILLTSMDRDGTMSGYAIELVRAVASAVDVPVIASGGAGSYEHLVEAVHAGASAVAAASMFLFTEQTPKRAKDAMRARGIPVRS